MLPLFCVMTGISHRVQLAILGNFPNALLNATRSILKKISDVVALGTFCYRNQSFISRRGSVIFFHGRRGTELDPPHTHTKQVEQVNSVNLYPPPKWLWSV